MQTSRVVLRERCNCSDAPTRRRRFLLGATATRELGIARLADVVRLAAACGFLVALTALPARAQALRPTNDVGSRGKEIGAVRSESAQLVTGDPAQINAAVPRAGETAAYPPSTLVLAVTPVNPPSATGLTYPAGVTINGNELTVDRNNKAGFRAWFHAQLSNWDPTHTGTGAPDAPRMAAYQIKIDCTGYYHSDCKDVNPDTGLDGLDLVPAVQICGTHADCRSGPNSFGEAWVKCVGGFCENGYLDLLGTGVPSPEGAGKGWCAGDGCFASAVFTGTCDYIFFGVFDNPLGKLDEGGLYYGGTLVLDLPAEAKGKYTVNLNIDETFAASPGTPPVDIPPIAENGFVINYVTGSCCYGLGTPDAGCADGTPAGGGVCLNQSDCAAMPQPSVFAANSLCSNPPTADSCTECLNDGHCDDNDACTTERCDTILGICFRGLKAGWNTATHCCNPADGSLTQIDDAEPCTTDTCNPGPVPPHAPPNSGNGVATHTWTCKVEVLVDFNNINKIKESDGNEVTATASNLPAEAKTRVIGKIKEKYAAALGEGMVNVEEGAVGGGVGTGDYAVIISGGKGPPTKDPEYGDAGAGKGKPGIIHGGFFKNVGFADTEALKGLSNAVGETAAHEVGHQINGGGHNGSKGKLMTDGGNLSKEQRENDARSFSDLDKEKLRKNLTKNTAPKSTGTAKDVVSACARCGLSPPSPEDPDFIPDDHIWDGVVWYEGERPGLEIGYINEDASFIFQGDATQPGDPELDSSVGVMSFPGHGQETRRWVLALRDGANVYGFDNFGVGEPILSDTNPLNGSVFRKVELRFDLDGNGLYDHWVFVDSSITSPTTGGFTQAGACCDTLNGLCEDEVVASDCQGEQREWTKGATCTEVECPIATGACCDHDAFGECRDGVPLRDCECDRCDWLKDAVCAEIECTHEAIPTVSQWGLVVLTLLLLTGAKVYFGRRLQAAISR